MRRRRLAACLGLLAAGCVALAAQQPPAPPSSQQGVFRGGVELVSLNVTAMEGSRYVTDLNQDEFEVFEDGAKQEVTFFARGRQPIALATGGGWGDTNVTFEGAHRDALTARIWDGPVPVAELFAELPVAFLLRA